MAKLTLYHAAPSRSSIVRWMLEEIGEPYDIQLLSLSKGDNRAPDYLAVNPMGKVPALGTATSVITEAAAICAYLADEFPRAKLNVPVGDPRRGRLSQMAVLRPELHRARDDGPRLPAQGGGAPRACWATAISIPSSTSWRRRWRAGPIILGEQFTAADVVIGSGLRFGMLFKLLPERPEFTAYTGRLAQRPALQRAEARTRNSPRREERAPRRSAEIPGIFSDFTARWLPR